MEKLFETFLNNRKCNEGFRGLDNENSIVIGEQNGFLSSLTALDVDEFDIESFMKDLTKIKDKGKLHGDVEYNMFRDAIIEKERNKIWFIADQDTLQVERKKIEKLKKDGVLADDAYNQLAQAIVQEVKDISSGTAIKRKQQHDAALAQQRRNSNANLKDFMTVPKKKGCLASTIGCLGTLVKIHMVGAVVICALWMTNCGLQKAAGKKFHKAGSQNPTVVFENKNDSKSVSGEPDEAKVIDSGTPVDTLVGYDKMKNALSSRLDALKPEQKTGMEQSLRYVMLEMALRDPKSSLSAPERQRIVAERDKMKIGANRYSDVYVYARERWLEASKEQNVKRIVADKDEEKKAKEKEGIISSTYDEVLNSLIKCYNTKIAKMGQKYLDIIR